VASPRNCRLRAELFTFLESKVSVSFSAACAAPSTNSVDRDRVISEILRNFANPLSQYWQEREFWNINIIKIAQLQYQKLCTEIALEKN
jgi:hypothetical protein